MAPAEILHFKPGLIFATLTAETLKPGDHAKFKDSHGHDVEVTCLGDDSATLVEHLTQIRPAKRDLIDWFLKTEQPPLYDPPIQSTLGDGGEFRCGDGPTLSLVVKHKKEL